ncbi:hypothetical protein MTR67_002584 [Solanum verrucosum]|nr:hypothetical protein MTR67_002584 [Solanum verrucosum]
MTNLVS